MDENENIVRDEDIETLEATKELVTLKDLSLEALDNIETLYQEDTEIPFEEERQENVLEEEEKDHTSLDKDEKKKSFWGQLKQKWQGLSKKNKILIIVGIVVVLLVLLGILLYFVFFNDSSEEELEKEPDVILVNDNYRYENGRLVFLAGKEELGGYTCENKNEELCKVSRVLSDSIIDDVRRVDAEGKPVDFLSNIYFNRFVFIFDNAKEDESKLNLYDIKNEKIVSTVFDILPSFEYQNYLILKNDSGKYGLFKMTDEDMISVIPYSYDEIHFLPGQNDLSFVSVRMDNNFYLANLENKILTKALTEPIMGANEHYIKVKSSKYDVYDYNAKKISDGSYDYITLLDEVFLGVNSNKLFVMDYKGNKMSADGFVLHNDKYNIVETYKDSKRIKKEVSYSYDKQGNNLSLDVYEAEDSSNYTLNLEEGFLSSRLPYLQYFDGLLYVYEDQAKTKLLGKYECTNKNNVDKDTTSLNSCKPAMDSVFRETRNVLEKEDYSEGVIPVFGKKYMFIQDGDTINLYDLSTEKVLAKYESVDTSSYTGSTELTMAMTTNVPFIAKSKSSSKFGVANITSDGVKPLIPFENESILLLGDYYVVAESKESYSLYHLDGKKVDGFVPKVSPIVDYHKDYLKTMKDDMYYVHGFKEDISDTAYNYIELYDEFYAAVLNNRVHLYRYDDKNKEKTEYIYDETNEKTGLELITKDYYGHDVNAFRITFDATNIYVEIGNTNGTYGKKMTFLKKKVEKPEKPLEPEKPVVSPSEEDKNDNKEDGEENG